MSFETNVKKAFEEAKAKLDKKYQESAKIVESEIMEARDKTYKRLGKET